MGSASIQAKLLWAGPCFCCRLACLVGTTVHPASSEDPSSISSIM
jgi:hypothetical protein